uniref:Uncharacterized protein n=1 Tax=Anguilla anguilla TaxID=7936 RepID=A0A0E9PQE4_ANGAN
MIMHFKYISRTHNKTEMTLENSRM